MGVSAPTTFDVFAEAIVETGSLTGKTVSWTSEWFPDQLGDPGPVLTEISATELQVTFPRGSPPPAQLYPGYVLIHMLIDGVITGNPLKMTTELLAPIANFSARPLTGTAPLSVTFSDASANLPTSWAWDFQNLGSTDSTLQNPVYVYNDPGTYSVKLTATNVSGSDILVKTGYVTAAGPPVRIYLDRWSAATEPNLSTHISNSGAAYIDAPFGVGVPANGTGGTSTMILAGNGSVYSSFEDNIYSNVYRSTVITTGVNFPSGAFKVIVDMRMEFDVHTNSSMNFVYPLTPSSLSSDDFTQFQFNTTSCVIFQTTGGVQTMIGSATIPTDSGIHEWNISYDGIGTTTISYDDVILTTLTWTPPPGNSQTFGIESVGRPTPAFGGTPFSRIYSVSVFG